MSDHGFDEAKLAVTIRAEYPTPLARVGPRGFSMLRTRKLRLVGHGQFVVH